jgi:phosphoesterase RecJ-like protein
MRIEEIIGNAGTIGIAGHVRPDGDCIGSCMGMYLYLKKVYPEAAIDVFLETIPEIYDFIPDTGKIRTDFRTDVDRYDAFIILDTAKDRTSGAEALFDNACVKINIDHHISNKGCGDFNYIFPKASSASELAYKLMDPEFVDRDIAMALYSGIISDTGVFKYSNTSPETMRIAADLIGYGFAFDELIDHVFYEKTFRQNQLLGRALLDAKLECDGHIIVSVTDLDTMKEYDAIPCDLEGIVSQLQLTTGVDCAVYLHQMSEEEFKVSLRSSGRVNVAEVAQIYGGGGHARAAGITMQGNADDLIAVLLSSIKKYL